MAQVCLALAVCTATGCTAPPPNRTENVEPEAPEVPKQPASKEAFQSTLPKHPFEPNHEQIAGMLPVRFSDQIEDTLGIPRIEATSEDVDLRFLCSRRSFIRITRTNRLVRGVIYKVTDASPTIGKFNKPRICDVEAIVMKDPVMGGSALCPGKLEGTTWMQLLERIEAAGVWDMKSTLVEGHEHGVLVHSIGPEVVVNTTVANFAETLERGSRCDPRGPCTAQH